MRFALPGFALLLVSWLAPGQRTPATVSKVPVETVTQPTFGGRLYLPPPGVSRARTVVLLIGGSEGHLYLADEIAPQLARAGYAAFGVDYHDGFKGPRALANIPIETFTTAAAWLHASNEVGAQRVVALGDSRGSEAAVLAAAHSDQINGLALFVPSSLVWGPTGAAPPSGASAWTWAGKPLPFARSEGKPGAAAFRSAIKETPAGSATRLPIEGGHGPILLAGSDADGVWDSGAMCRQLQSRLHERGFGYPVTAFVAPASSHRMLGTGPSAPDETYTYPGGSYAAHFGGTAAGTEQAREMSWRLLLAFLSF